MALSRWTDTLSNDIDKLINTMLDFESWYKFDVDPKNNQKLGVNIEKVFSNHQEITVNNSEITYNLIKYEYEKVRPGAKDESLRLNRIQSVSGFILIYTDGTQIQYITDRSNNNSTKTILRKFTNAEKNLEIISEPLNITEDLFVWMIYKVLSFSAESLEDDSNLYLKKIIGFKGEAKDRLAEITGTGNRILNQLSTLAFLFENEKVTFIKTKVEYERETIEFSIDLKGNVDIDFETYVGNYFMEEENKKICNVILLIFLEILPKIISSYFIDIENDLWHDKLKISFFTNIGKSISNKIEEKMGLIK